MQKKYYQLNKDKILAQHRERTKIAKDKGICTSCKTRPASEGFAHCMECRDYYINLRRNAKKEVLMHYGNKHRKDLKRINIYLWLIRNHYPEGFRVLCWNCNCGRQYNYENPGICPHNEDVNENKTFWNI